MGRIKEMEVVRQAEGRWCLKDILSFGSSHASDLPKASFAQALFKVGN